MPSLRPARRFAPSAAATVAVAILLPILVALGCWQIARGQMKAGLLVQAQQADAAAPLDLAPGDAVDALPERRRVRVRGEFLADRQGLLDNQVRDGQVGYDVLTPLRVEGRAAVLLVDRGWVARGARRSDVPHWQTPTGAVTLTGYLYTPANVPLVTGDVADTFGGNWVVLEIDPGALQTAARAPVEPRVLRLTPESDFGFRRDWPVVSMTPQRHYAYAVQWFGMAVALVVIYAVGARRRARMLAMTQETQ
jgi:surfeit locus 1 family protein